MSQSLESVLWPVLGVGHHAGHQIKAAPKGAQSVFDLLIAAIVLNEKTWPKLASLLALEWDEDKLRTALRFVDAYVKCVSADGVIDVRSIMAILHAVDRTVDLGAHNVDIDPRLRLPRSAVIRRNWLAVRTFGGQRVGNPIKTSDAFANVEIPWDKEMLVAWFGSAFKIANGGTRVAFDREMYRNCLELAGLSGDMPSPPSFLALVTTGWRAIDEGKDDPVDVHFADRKGVKREVVCANPPKPPAPTRDGPSVRSMTGVPPPPKVVASPPPGPIKKVDWDEEARIAQEAAKAREERKAEQVSMAAAAEAEEVRLRTQDATTEALDKPASAEALPPVADPSSVRTGPEVILSDPETAMYEVFHRALGMLGERGHPVDRMSTDLMYPLIKLPLPTCIVPSGVAAKMAEKKVLEFLTERRKGYAGVVAVNTVTPKRSCFSKAKPTLVTDEQVRACIDKVYPDAASMAAAIDFVTKAEGPAARWTIRSVKAPVAEEPAPEPPPAPAVVSEEAVVVVASEPEPSVVVEPEVVEAPSPTVEPDVVITMSRKDLMELIDARINEARVRWQAEQESVVQMVRTEVGALFKGVMAEVFEELVERAIDKVVERK